MPHVVVVSVEKGRHFVCWCRCCRWWWWCFCCYCCCLLVLFCWCCCLFDAVGVVVLCVTDLITSCDWKKHKYCRSVPRAGPLESAILAGEKNENAFSSFLGSEMVILLWALPVVRLRPVTQKTELARETNNGRKRRFADSHTWETVHFLFCACFHISWRKNGR